MTAGAASAAPAGPAVDGAVQPARGSVVTSGSATVPDSPADACVASVSDGAMAAAIRQAGQGPWGASLGSASPQRGQGWGSVMVGWLRTQGGNVHLPKVNPLDDPQMGTSRPVIPAETPPHAGPTPARPCRPRPVRF